MRQGVTALIKLTYDLIPVIDSVSLVWVLNGKGSVWMIRNHVHMVKVR